MNGLPAFLRKELREIRHTSRMWVLPGILLFLGVTSPIIAELTPLLVKSAGNQPGVIIQMPEPTYVEAYQNYLGQLNQLMVIAVVIASAGLISSEVNRGTAILVLTKPVSRAGFFLAKVLSQTVVLVASTLLGTLAALALTAALFPQSPVGTLFAAVGLWLAFAWLLLLISAVYSTLMSSTAGAAGAGLGTWLVIVVLSQLGPLDRYSPAALVGEAGRLIGGEAVSPLVPLLVTAAVAGALLLGGMRLMQVKEL